MPSNNPEQKEEAIYKQIFKKLNEIDGKLDTLLKTKAPLYLFNTGEKGANNPNPMPFPKPDRKVFPHEVTMIADKVNREIKEEEEK